MIARSSCANGRIRSEKNCAIHTLEKANDEHPSEEGLELAKYMRDVVIPGYTSCNTSADCPPGKTCLPSSLCQQ